MKKKSTITWREKAIEKWNATTFRQYLSDQHEERFGIPYVCNSIPMEAKNIRRMIDTYGPEITKTFIDECIRQHSPSHQYPGISFWFMFAYKRESILPKVLKAHQDKSEELTTQTMSIEEATDWF
ncbi:hypothetical protein [Thermoactinomyces sp. DSM 45892]|uniref:hypothetical protein n=1 Tax=Thermoactinomyces sp. DSM 45892 TaxID=1882753 RepID=UPI0008998958|nr:hypothetical protein [Thermoactinomyces sp. DSM 45892]SDZ05595.1 hypothetical protein SAMN05444416_112101 [Thermoactinomyces sp. DSM 45892]